MKYTATIKSEKGYLAEISGKISTVSQMTPDLLKKFDKLPDEIDGVKVHNWTEITIVIENK